VGAIRFLNIDHHEVVHQRLLLVRGYWIAKEGTYHHDGGDSIKKIVVVYHQNFPSLKFPIYEGHFKALVQLDPGENVVSFVIASESPRVVPEGGDAEPDLEEDTTNPKTVIEESRETKTELRVNYLPLLQNPPLRLAILLAADRYTRSFVETPTSND